MLFSLVSRSRRQRSEAPRLLAQAQASYVAGVPRTPPAPPGPTRPAGLGLLVSYRTLARPRRVIRLAAAVERTFLRVRAPEASSQQRVGDEHTCARGSCSTFKRSPDPARTSTPVDAAAYGRRKDAPQHGGSAHGPLRHGHPLRAGPERRADGHDPTVHAETSGAARRPRAPRDAQGPGIYYKTTRERRAHGGRVGPDRVHRRRAARRLLC